MKAVLQTIRILVIILHVADVLCQDGYSNQDILRFQQISNEGQIDPITNYSANVFQRDPNIQAMSSVNAQYHLIDEADKSENYHRADRSRSRKVYRIRNPFQRQLEDDGRQQESSAGSQDVETGASNQYASMQYSLPPEEFLQQMRAESQYYQQQQVSTPAPSLSYTATPQPYQYSTAAPSAFDTINQQTNQLQQLESKLSQAQSYRSLANAYQYNPGSYGLESQSTASPAPPYISTSLPSAQFVGTPTNTYVSSSSPMFLSSQPNLFVSSSISAIQAGTPDYNNKVTSTIGSSYDNSDMNRKMQIDHYDNSVNGIRYPPNMQQQYQSDYPTSTVSPPSTPYPDPLRDSWQNTVNSGNALSKSLPEVSLSHYQKYQPSFNRNQPSDQSPEPSSETQRIGNYPSPNNVYLNYVQPDYQTLANLRGRARDLEQETGQQDYYSHGEYGWKMSDKKPLVHQNSYSSGGYPRYQPSSLPSSSLSSPSDGVAVSQMSFHMDTSKPAQNYDQISKSSSDTEALEFAKAAAKAHENQQKRQQLYGNIYSSNFDSNPYASASLQANAYYGHEKPRNPYLYSNSQQDLITASPYYYTHGRENSDEKLKQPFDHDKALKTIVPIDVTSAVNSEATKAQGLDNNRFAIQNYNKDQEQPGLKQYKSITDAFYQDKNSIYGFNIKPKQEDTFSQDQLKLIDSQYFGKQPTQEQYHGNQGLYLDSKRYNDGFANGNYIGQQNSYHDNSPSPANVQQQGLQQPQNPPSDIQSILKLNDLPYRLTQNLPPETFRLNNNNYELNLPSPLPSRLNQNVASHQTDVAAGILNKLMANKQPGQGRPELEHQTSAISTINGFKVANPFNVDLKLVADMLKGRHVLDDSHMLGYRDQFARPAPVKLDIAQLQQMLLKNDNIGNLVQFSDGPGVYSAPFLDMYGSGRYPYTGVKYSRSQEEEESISVPIADASNTHPIGAVIEQDDQVNQEVSSGSELTGNDGEAMPEISSFNDRPKTQFSPNIRDTADRHRHPNAVMAAHHGRHGYPRKYPKSSIEEPYPLLKPPPPHHKSRSRSSYRSNNTHHRRRRPRRPKSHLHRIMKTEPLFEAENEETDQEPMVLLQPPPQAAESKSDKTEEPSPS